MNRREFLSVSLAGLAALLLRPEVWPSPSASLKPSFHLLAGPAGAPVRRRVQAILGPQYQVHSLYQNPSGYLAEVSFAGLPFYLKSTDGVAWYTAEFSNPASLQASAWKGQTAEAAHG